MRSSIACSPWALATFTAIGLGVSAMLVRAVSAIIFGVAPRDPLTYG